MYCRILRNPCSRSKPAGWVTLIGCDCDRDCYRYFNPSLPQFSIVRLSSSNEALPTIKEERFRDHLIHLDIEQTRWDAPEGAEGAGHCLWSLKDHGSWGCSWWLEKGRNHTHLQEGQEGEFRELRASQPHVNPWEGYEANPDRNHFLNTWKAKKVIEVAWV